MKAHYKVKEARNAAKALIAKKLEELRVEMKAAIAAGDTKRYGTLMVEFVSFGGMD
jgi:DNA-binding GntR family transcriptional regulator